MKSSVVIFAILLLLFLVFQCEKKNGPPKPDREDPNYYFPRNIDYKWTYVRLGDGCVPTVYAFVITVTKINTRPEGSGFELVSSLSMDTGFVYQVWDSIFYKNNVKLPLPPYKLLVRPIKNGASWRDAYGYVYSVEGFEDLPSSVAGGTYQGCVVIRRTASGSNRMQRVWWAPQYGKVREAEFTPSGSGDTLHCEEGGIELMRLEKNPNFP